MPDLLRLLLVAAGSLAIVATSLIAAAFLALRRVDDCCACDWTTPHDPSRNRINETDDV